MALIPFVYIWRIIKEVLEVAPNYAAAQGLAQMGRMAVLFAVLSMLVYICALMCSHIAAFRVQANMKSEAMHHIAGLPLGFIENVGSGKIRKTVNDSSAATETYLAHQLPDMAGAYVTPVALIIMLMSFDWRLGLLSLVPVIIAFAIMASMTGKKMQQKMKEYQNSLDTMSNEAVEYVRGIPVVKTFGQSVYSFKRFKKSIDEYGKWVISYTKDLRMPMVFYTTVINGVFAVLIAAALVLAQKEATSEFLLNILFYIIITPIITVTLNKIMFSSENKMIVVDAFKRIDSILDEGLLTEAPSPKSPKDNSIQLDNAVFRYPGADKNAID